MGVSIHEIGEFEYLLREAREGDGSLSQAFVARLPEGPVDVVGDVHGEIDPLEALLDRLGYDRRGEHPDRRKLVFVGDLCDRGPNSPAVVGRVRELVDRRNAFCILGNHELNILRGSQKSGNRWFLDPSHPEQHPEGEFGHCLPMEGSASSDVLEFFASLPLALERSDLRIVHAAWVRDAVETVRQSSGSTLDLYEHFEGLTEKRIQAEGLEDAAREEEEAWGDLLADKFAPVPLLKACGKLDEIYQMGNPIRVLTSGVERLAQRPFFASGKWRMCDRVRWWNEYDEDVPVVIGHYWRQLVPIAHSEHASTKPELFTDDAPLDWGGRRRNVYCVDFSIGARYQERKSGAEAFATRLAAMRLPERSLILSEDSD